MEIPPKFLSGKQIGLNYLQLACFQLSFLTKLLRWLKTLKWKVQLAVPTWRSVVCWKLVVKSITQGIASMRSLLILLLSLDLLPHGFFFNWFTAALKVISDIFLPQPLPVPENQQGLNRKNFHWIQKKNFQSAEFILLWVFLRKVFFDKSHCVVVTAPDNLLYSVHVFSGLGSESFIILIGWFLLIRELLVLVQQPHNLR